MLSGQNILESDPGMDKFLIFLFVMKVLPEYVDNGKGEKTLDFTKKYHYPLNEIDELQQISEFSQPYKEHCGLLHH